MRIKTTFNSRIRNSILFSFLVLAFLLNCDRENNVLSPYDLEMSETMSIVMSGIDKQEKKYTTVVYYMLYYTVRLR